MTSYLFSLMNFKKKKINLVGFILNVDFVFFFLFLECERWARKVRAAKNELKHQSGKILKWSNLGLTMKKSRTRSYIWKKVTEISNFPQKKKKVNRNFNLNKSKSNKNFRFFFFFLSLPSKEFKFISLLLNHRYTNWRISSNIIITEHLFDTIQLIWTLEHLVRAEFNFIFNLVNDFFFSSFLNLCR